jgi:putative ABC transport system permease protein
MLDHIKYAFKSLLKNKAYTLINIGGLTLGLSVAIALAMSIIGLASLDQFHENKETVYKLTHTDDSTSGSWNDASSAMLAPAIFDALPEVTDYCQYLWANDNILGTPENNVKENGFYVDEGWFRMLSFPLVYGDADHVLSDPNNIVISESLAGKLFGDKNPLGETINLYSFELEKPEVFTISGVFEDVPIYSTLQFEFAIPFSWYSNRNNWIESWDNIGTRSYIKIAPGTNTESLSRNITKLARSLNDRMRDTQIYGLAPLHKSNQVVYTLSGEPSFGFYIIMAMLIVGFSILVISIINYVNLSVATSLKRAKEIGVKKIHGAGRTELVKQFFAETLIVVTLSGIMASFLHVHILNMFLPEQQSLVFSISPYLLMVLGALLLFTIIITTWYPAVYMSRFSPLMIFSNSGGGSSSLSLSRKSLVVLQFFAAIILITTSVVLSRQVNFMLNQSLGMDRYNTVYFVKNKQLDSHREAFTMELVQKAGIESVTFADQLPFEVGNAATSISWEGKDPLDQNWYSTLSAGKNFATTLKINLVEGRDFNEDDENKIIINKSAAKLMQMERPIGNIINMHGNQKEIIGVVENFKYQMMNDPDKPLFIQYQPENAVIAFVRLAGGSQGRGLESLGEVFHKFSPDFILDYNFLDSEFDYRFSQLKSMGRIMTISGYLAIIIACMGLLGLTVHTSERKVKELGIRKINGAGIVDLVRLLSGQMVKSILTAAAMAYPMAFFINKALLQNFAERIQLSMLHFIWSFVILIGLTTLIVGWHILWAARRNPVEALRDE